MAAVSVPEVLACTFDYRANVLQNEMNVEDDAR